MTLPICKICKQIKWYNTHRCPPKWLCWVDDERDDEGYVIYSWGDFCDAASVFVEMMDSESGMEYTNGGRNNVTVFVRKSDEEGPPISVTVVPEAVIEYTGYVNKDE